jgi:uncharacterized membrane protein required for colicin V production
VTITFFDILVLFALLGGAVLGFFRGFFRQAAATLVLYIAIVMASLAYPYLSRVLSQLTGQLSHATDVLAFFVIMALVMILLFLGRNDLMSNTNTDRMGIWHNLSGMVFGFLNAAIICAVVVIVLRSVTAGDSWPAYGAIQTFFRRQLARSFMVYVFGPFTRLIISLVELWLFGGRLPPLLRNAL